MIYFGVGRGVLVSGVTDVIYFTLYLSLFYKQSFVFVRKMVRVKERQIEVKAGCRSKVSE